MRHILLLFSLLYTMLSFAQQGIRSDSIDYIRVSGIVMDEDSNAVWFANVVIKHEGDPVMGMVTNEDGYFEMMVPTRFMQSSIMEVQFIGFATNRYQFVDLVAHPLHHYILKPPDFVITCGGGCWGYYPGELYYEMKDNTAGTFVYNRDYINRFIR